MNSEPSALGSRHVSALYQSINQSTLFRNITSIYKFCYAIKTKLTRMHVHIIANVSNAGGMGMCIWARLTKTVQLAKYYISPPHYRNGIHHPVEIICLYCGGHRDVSEYI